MTVGYIYSKIYWYKDDDYDFAHIKPIACILS